MWGRRANAIARTRARTRVIPDPFRAGIDLKEVARKVIGDQDVEAEPFKTACNLLHARGGGGAAGGDAKTAECRSKLLAERADTEDAVDGGRKSFLVPHIFGDTAVVDRRIFLHREIAEVRELVGERRVVECPRLRCKARVALREAPDNEWGHRCYQDPLADIELAPPKEKRPPARSAKRSATGHAITICDGTRTASVRRREKRVLTRGRRAQRTFAQPRGTA